MDFYCAPYRAEDKQGLPQLSHRDQPTLDTNISLEEVSAGVGPVASGPPPGLDGLTSDFYIHFY